MAHHNLKLFTDHYQPFEDGLVNNTVRVNDREPPFQVDDTITQHEGYSSINGYVYTGRKKSAVITHISTYGLKPGFVNLSLGRVGLTIVHKD